MRISKVGGKSCSKKRGGQKGSGCGNWKVMSGGKKHSKKKKQPNMRKSKAGGKSCSKKRGGSSQFLARSAYAVGPSNGGDGSWCGSARSQFGSFANPSYFVPNSALARGYANPQLAGLTGKFCGK